MTLIANAVSFLQIFSPKQCEKLRNNFLAHTVLASLTHTLNGCPPNFVQNMRRALSLSLTFKNINHPLKYVLRKKSTQPLGHLSRIRSAFALSFKITCKVSIRKICKYTLVYIAAYICHYMLIYNTYTYIYKLYVYIYIYLYISTLYLYVILYRYITSRFFPPE